MVKDARAVAPPSPLLRRKPLREAPAGALAMLLLPTPGRDGQLPLPAPLLFSDNACASCWRSLPPASALVRSRHTQKKGGECIRMGET